MTLVAWRVAASGSERDVQDRMADACLMCAGDVDEDEVGEMAGLDTSAISMTHQVGGSGGHTEDFFECGGVVEHGHVLQDLEEDCCFGRGFGGCGEEANESVAQPAFGVESTLEFV